GPHELEDVEDEIERDKENHKEEHEAGQKLRERPQRGINGVQQPVGNRRRGNRDVAQPGRHLLYRAACPSNIQCHVPGALFASKLTDVAQYSSLPSSMTLRLLHPLSVD